MRKALLNARIERNLTQEEVAQKAGISRSAYTNIERGVKKSLVRCSSENQKRPSVARTTIFFLDSMFRNETRREEHTMNLYEINVKGANGVKHKSKVYEINVDAAFKEAFIQGKIYGAEKLDDCTVQQIQTNAGVFQRHRTRVFGPNQEHSGCPWPGQLLRNGL